MILYNAKTPKTELHFIDIKSTGLTIMKTYHNGELVGETVDQTHKVHNTIKHLESSGWFKRKC